MPRAAVVTPNVAEARVLAGAGEEKRDRGARACRPRARSQGGGGHRRPPRGGDRHLLRRRASSWRSRASAIPAAAAHGSGCTHSSALAAQPAPGGSGRWRRRGTRRRSPSEAVRDGLRDIGAGAGPVDALGVRLTARRDGPGASGIIAGRSRASCRREPHERRPDQVPAHETRPRRGPPHGGDPRRARGRRAPGGGVPPPARRGDVGGGARRGPASGRREAQMVRDYADIPPEAERVIFFPRAAGG